MGLTVKALYASPGLQVSHSDPVSDSRAVHFRSSYPVSHGRHLPLSRWQHLATSIRPIGPLHDDDRFVNVLDAGGA